MRPKSRATITTNIGEVAANLRALVEGRASDVIEEPTITYANGDSSARYRIERVKPALPVPLPALFVELAMDRPSNFQITYRINSASLRAEVEGTLHIVSQRGG